MTGSGALWNGMKRSLAERCAGEIGKARMTKQAQDSAVYLITGEDDFVVDQRARSIVDSCCPEEERALGLEVVDGDVELVDEALQALGGTCEAVQTVGFFGGRKLVWLRRARMFGDHRVGQSESVKQAAEALSSIIKSGLPDGHRLVISACKVDKRSAFFKACKAGAEVIDLNPQGRPAEVARALVEQVRDVWQEYGLQPASASLVKDFVDIVGPDMRRLRSEVSKLSDYMGDQNRKVSPDDVAAVVSAGKDSIAWTLQDEIGARHSGAALHTLRQLLFQGENAIGLVFAIESRIRELLLLRECMRRKWLTVTGSGDRLKTTWNLSGEDEARLEELPKNPCKIHPFRLGKLVSQASCFTFRELLRAHQDVTETHEKLVSSSVPNELELEMMILRVTRVKI